VRMSKSQTKSELEKTIAKARGFVDTTAISLMKRAATPPIVVRSFRNRTRSPNTATVASPAIVMTSVIHWSSSSPCIPSTAKPPIIVIARISNIRSTASEENPVVNGIFFIFLSRYARITSPIRAGRITFADWLNDMHPTRKPRR